MARASAPRTTGKKEGARAEQEPSFIARNILSSAAIVEEEKLAGEDEL